MRALPKFYQRFKIDDHLQRFGSALRNLSLAGSDHFDDAMSYVEHHQLYEEAVSIWKDSERYQVRSRCCLSDRPLNVETLSVRTQCVWKLAVRATRVHASCSRWVYDFPNMRNAKLTNMLVFAEAHQPSKAMIAYEKALSWQDLFDLATREHVGEEEIVSMGYRVAGLISIVSLECDLIFSLLSRRPDIKKTLL